MYVRSIHISGFADLPALALDGLERVVHIAGPSPAATAVGDGLALCFAALSEPVLIRLLNRWGLLEPDEIPEVEHNPLPIQVAWADRTQAKALVADPSERRLQVTLELIPDPPLFAELRALGAKAPRMSSALGSDPVVRLQVSGFFAASWDVLSLAVQSFSVGEESFPTTGKERPDWLTSLLQRIGSRFAMHSPTSDVAAQAMAAMTSAETRTHAGFVAWQRALAPDLGDVRPARGPADAPILLSDGLPMRRFGHFGTTRAALASSAYFSGADMLWAGHCDPWVDGCVEGEGSPLEQVWRLDREGPIDPICTTDDAVRSVLSFTGSTGEE